MGIETATCVQFAAEYRADNDALEDTMGKYRDLSSMSIAQQRQILRAYCYDHPAATYRNGINALIELPDDCAFRTPTGLSTPAIR
jgi:hypothetical protein